MLVAWSGTMMERIRWFGEDAKPNQLSAKPNQLSAKPNQLSANPNKRKMPNRTGGKPNKDGRIARKELIAWTGGHAGTVYLCRMVGDHVGTGKVRLWGNG